MASCGKPAVGRFHYTDSLGGEHADEPLCQGHATQLFSKPEPSGTARAHTAPGPKDSCVAVPTEEG